MTLTIDDRTRERFWSKVDKSGECWVWAGAKPTNYGKFDKTPAHRLSWEMHNGPIPEGMYIDHICHTKRCVRPEHLRLATPKQNLEHVKLSAANTSGYRGVVWNKKSGYWQAVVVHNYHRHFLGFFDTAEEADAAARAKRLELYTHNEIDRVVGADDYTPPPTCGAPTRSRAHGPCKFKPHHGSDRCWRHQNAGPLCMDADRG